MKDETILTVNSLRAGYGETPAITDVSFSLKRGEILCLVGESGCGKSTILKTLIAAPSVHVFSGGIRLYEKEVLVLPEKERRQFCTEKMGMIFQSPGAAFNPIRTYEKQFIETLKSHGKYRANTFQKEAFHAFEKMDLKEAERILHQCPYALSGGMNQRVAFVLAMLLHQEILLCDEPTSALDATTALQVVKELVRLRDQEGISQIIVTHNLAMAGAVADRIGVMYGGKLVEIGETQKLLRNPRHAYTKKLIDAIPAWKKNLSEQAVNTGVVLEVRGLSKSYPAHKKEVGAVKNVNLSLEKGEILGIVGESGCGKTTLLKLISGLEKPTSGEILLNGKMLSNRRKKEDFRAMQMIFQDAVASFHPRRTIADSIQETVQSLCGKKVEVHKRELSEEVGLQVELMDRLPGQLSGGQCQRFAIARAVAVMPQILLCDEITSALDVSTQEQIIRLLAKICHESGMSAIFVSHDLAVVTQLCDRVVVMQDGDVVEEGNTWQVIMAPQKEYTRKLIESVMEIKGDW